MTGEAHVIEMLESTKRRGHFEIDWYSSIRLGYCQLMKTIGTYCMMALKPVQAVLSPFLVCSLAIQ